MQKQVLIIMHRKIYHLETRVSAENFPGGEGRKKISKKIPKNSKKRL